MTAGAMLEFPAEMPDLTQQIPVKLAFHR